MGEPEPRALKRTPISVDEVLAGPEVAHPFTKDMCCVVTDAGGALVLARSERARDLVAPDRIVYLLGSGEAHESSMVSQMADPGSFGAFRQAGAEAFRTAGVDRKDIDHLMIYDAFAHIPLYGLEDLGFVGHGESRDFVADGHTSPGGSLPLNTNGGGLAYTHTGMYGMFAIQEAVRQVRGEAAVQVPGVRTSFVQGIGGFFWAAASLILSNCPS
ncbi:thiolase C-terminal domain-containing protein [Streptomyces sp. CA-100214]